MTKTSIDWQELRRRIYAKAKTEKTWKFWGLYVHICKMEILKAAYEMAKENNGAPGEDGVTFEQIEREGLENYLEEIKQELENGTYNPRKYREKAIPKGDGNVNSHHRNKKQAPASITNTPVRRSRMCSLKMMCARTTVTIEPSMEAGSATLTWILRKARRRQKYE